MARRVLTLLRVVAATAVAAVALASCRLDVIVDLAVGADGTGTMSVTATVDEEVVATTPGLADDLRLGDAEQAGWTVDGPTATDEGGLTVTLTHDVASAAEATNLLSSLGPPFTELTLERRPDGDTTINELTGRLVLPGGSFDAFADADLLAAVGGTPFADELAAAGADPSSSMAVTLRADLPGQRERTTGRTDGSAVEWGAPLDGTTLAVVERTVQRPASGGAWARPLAIVALVALVAWLAFAAWLAVQVVLARRRRTTRHQERAPAS